MQTHLGLPKLPEERLVILTERVTRARQAVATAHARRARVAPVIARADAAPVQVLRAIRRSGSPLADDRPQGEVGQLGGVAAGGIDAFLIRPADGLRSRHSAGADRRENIERTHLGIEHLVYVLVHRHSLVI